MRLSADTIPIKTPQGQAELGSRTRAVGQRHRTVLLLADGRRTASVVRSMARDAGVPENCFDELLAMGLLELTDAAGAQSRVDTRAGALGDEVGRSDAETPSAAADSLLPPSRTLYPESASTDSTLGTTAAPSPAAPDAALPEPVDPVFVEAQRIMLLAVRTEAPLVGSLTALRLRRARTRADLNELLAEVEARITKPHRPLAANLTMRRVRQLLDGRLQPSVASI